MTQAGSTVGSGSWALVLLVMLDRGSLVVVRVRVRSSVAVGVRHARGGFAGGRGPGTGGWEVITGWQRGSSRVSCRPRTRARARP